MRYQSKLFLSCLLLSTAAIAQGPPPPPPPLPPLAPPPAPPQNPVTDAKANLGKVLFWEEQLSSTRTVACGTCHIPRRGGSDPRSFAGNSRAIHPGPDTIFGSPDDIIGSPGVPQCTESGEYLPAFSFDIREQVTNRKSPPAINAGYSPQLFWDGRADGVFSDPVNATVLIPNGAALESQVLGPPLSTVEMAHLDRDWPSVVARLQEAVPLLLSPAVPQNLSDWIAGRNYPELFAEVFGSPLITPERIAMAIATYERTLFSNQAPIDLDTPANPQLTPLEQQGRQVFGQAGCAACHAGNRFTDEQFHYTGVRPVAEDLGRFAVTSNPADRGAMKTPGLRNVELHAPYFHNGRFNTLEEVIDFYNRGGDFNAPNKDPRMQPLNLTPQQRNALAAFLRRPLTDPRVAAESPPFDRPMLYTESDRVPRIEGSGRAGSGGFIPEIMAIEPPFMGNPSFTIALYAGLGGAAATLCLDTSDPGMGTTLPPAAYMMATHQLASTGAGQGHASAILRIPMDAQLLGLELFGRWYIQDPAAPEGMAISRLLRFTIFGNPDLLPSEGEGASEGTEEGTSEEGEAPGTSGSHTADRNRNGKIELSELLRLIQHYNAGEFHCDAASEDGYALGTGNRDCTPHNSDYAPQDWRINLSEMLRAIQLFTSGAYHDCPNASEDGYCPGQA